MSPHPTRRTVLGALGASWLPAARAAQAPSPLMARLSTYMSEAALRPLPDAVLEKTKQVVLDTFAAMISGSQLAPGKFAIHFARANAGDHTATVAASKVLCGPIEAALANGMLAHSDETDDTHPPSQSHPGCSVVPSALAAGEKFGIDGTRFLRAVALGYDIGTRVTIALGKLQYQVDSHRSTHALAGAFGSAAAAGCAAGLSAQQMRWLLSYTAQQASGLASWQRDIDHIEKAFDFGGMPARSGITAALLVEAGGTGVDDILSGADNFLEAFAPKNGADLLTEKLGERYEVMRTNFKKWTVGAPIQAVLDALEILLKKSPFEAAQVKQVTVRVATDEAAVVDNREIPDICLQHLVALMLIDKTVTFRSAHDKARMQDGRILRERAKVQLVKDAELEKRLPSRQAIVEVALANGTRMRERVEAVRGTVENPMTRDEVAAKARDLMAPVLGRAVSERLIQGVRKLGPSAPVRDLRTLLQAV